MRAKYLKYRMSFKLRVSKLILILRSFWYWKWKEP